MGRSPPGRRPFTFFRLRCANGSVSIHHAGPRSGEFLNAISGAARLQVAPLDGGWRCTTLFSGRGVDRMNPRISSPCVTPTTNTGSMTKAWICMGPHRGF